MNRDGPWIALDCGALRDPRVRPLGAAAKLLYIAGLCHCGDELTDGLIEPHALAGLYRETGARSRDVAALVAAGLWEPLEPRTSHDLATTSPRTSHRGRHAYRVRNYLKWNPSRAEWEKRRADNAKRQAAYRERQENESNASPPAKDEPRNASRNPSDERETKEKEQAQAPTGKRAERAGPLEDHLRSQLERLQDAAGGVV